MHERVRRTFGYHEVGGVVRTGRPQSRERARCDQRAGRLARLLARGAQTPGADGKGQIIERQRREPIRVDRFGDAARPRPPCLQHAATAERPDRARASVVHAPDCAFWRHAARGHEPDRFVHRRREPQDGVQPSHLENVMDRPRHAREHERAMACAQPLLRLHERTQAHAGEIPDSGEIENPVLRGRIEPLDKHVERGSPVAVEPTGEPQGWDGEIGVERDFHA